MTLGIAAFVISPTKSPTALIPAYLGALLEVFSFLSLFRPTWRKHAMHISVVLAAFGAGMALKRVWHLPLRSVVTESIRCHVWTQNCALGPGLTLPQIVCLLMATICLLYVMVSIGFFVKARILSFYQNSKT